jgi:hypothetical protein
MNILQLPWSRCYSPANIRQLNYSASCLQGNSSARITQKTRPLHCCRCLFTMSFHSKGREADHRENPVLLLSRACRLRVLPSNGHYLPSHCFATGICPTIYVDECVTNFLAFIWKINMGETYALFLTSPVWNGNLCESWKYSLPLGFRYKFTVADIDAVIFVIASGVGLSPLYCGHFWPISALPHVFMTWCLNK